ncbi:MAG: fumarylacetoacetate hydrolase family protein [Planctomycetota bacterium]|nr:fumarylacetoacetate hydrolase family protein [Planctomycetota bacterium]MDA1211495.1 fumarylacetoacetate hydrolase family protein [Planctomycetota bacterium]
MSRLAFFSSLLALCTLTEMSLSNTQADDKEGEKVESKVQKFVRFLHGNEVAYGLYKDDRVHEIEGDIFEQWELTDHSFPLSDITLLSPTDPFHVFAMAGNYKSHLKDEEIPEKFKIPQPFFKSPSSLAPHGGAIIYPKGAEDLHFEAELVLVIGKECSNVAEEDALDYLFGVTCGNDVSERIWQKSDVQWWRAKGADTFGPCGPFLVTGLDPDHLQMRLKLNGKVLQEENTDHLIHNTAKMISFISQHVTMYPGDLIFTGTPGKTSAMKPGDIVEVEIEGIGTLRNEVVKEE